MAYSWILSKNSKPRTHIQQPIPGLAQALRRDRPLMPHFLSCKCGASWSEAQVAQDLHLASNVGAVQ